MHTPIRIEIDGHPHEVQQHRLIGKEILKLGHHERGELYLLDPPKEQKFIPDDDIVELNDGQRFVIVAEHEAITIVIEGTPYETRKRAMTGSELKELGDQPPANRLYRIEGTQRVRIEDDQRVHLHCGEEFVTQPPCGHAS